MAVDPKQFSELMNSLQAALLLALRLEPDVRQASREAGQLRAAVERAVEAAQKSRPDQPEGS